jgi:hypothetical protein
MVASLNELALDAIHFSARTSGEAIHRQTAALLGGYASARRGVVQLDESAGVVDPEHELAHAWFTTDDFTELWLREGMAEWVATAMSGQTCAPATGGDTGLDLSDWQVVRPTANADTIDQVILDQQAAACGIVTRAVMPAEQ